MNRHRRHGHMKPSWQRYEQNTRLNCSFFLVDSSMSCNLQIRQEFFLEKQAIVEKLKEDQYIARVQSNAKSVRFEVGAIDEPQDSSSKPSNPANKRGGAGFDEDQWTKARYVSSCCSVLLWL